MATIIDNDGAVLVDDEGRELLTHPVELYVSADGSSSATGASGDALDTIASAASMLRSTQLDAPATVYLDGDFRVTAATALTEADSGTTDYPITYQGRNCTINGSTVVSGTWQTHSGEIKYIDLPGQAAFNSLIVGGTLATRARTPNAGTYYEMQPYDVGEGTVTDYFWANPADLPTIGAGETIHVCAYVGFLFSRSYISTIEVAGTPRQVNTTGGPTHGYNYRADYGRYFLEGSLSFLDEAGEWYWDDANERLYYWPRAGEVLGTSVVEIPQTTSLLTLTGSTNSLSPANSGCTVSLRFRTSYSSGDATWRKVLFSNNTAGTAGIRIALDKSVAATGVPFLQAANATYTATASADLTDGQWHHLCCVNNAGTWTIYVDDASVGSSALGVVELGDEAPWIGARSDAAGTFFEGDIADVIVLDRICDATEVAALGDLDYTGLEADFIFHAPLHTDFGDATGNLGEKASEIRYLDNSTVVSREPVLNTTYATFDGVDDSVSWVDQPFERVEHVHFRDITFENADWELLAGGHWDWESGYNDAESIAISVNRARDVTFTGCTVRNVGSVGLAIERSIDCEVFNCDIHDTGGTGLVCVGAPSIVADSMASGNRLERCRIHDTGRVARGGCGAYFEHAKSCTITHNTVYNAPYCGIRCYSTLNSLETGAGSNTITWNRIHDVMQELMDGGGIMVSGRQVWTVISHNYVYDVLETSLHTTESDEFRGLYMDEGSNGITVHHNIFANCHQSYLFHQANDCVVYNNVFADSEVGGLWMLLGTKYLDDGQSTTYPVDMHVYNNVYVNSGGARMYHLYIASAAYLTSMGNPFASTHDNFFGEDEFLEQVNVTSTTRAVSFLQSTYTLETDSIVGAVTLGSDWMPPLDSTAYNTGFERFSLAGVGAEGVSTGGSVTQGPGRSAVASTVISPVSFHPALLGA